MIRSPLNWSADWISRRKPGTEEMLAIAVLYLMASSFITLVAIGTGIEIVPILFG